MVDALEAFNSGPSIPAGVVHENAMGRWSEDKVITFDGFTNHCQEFSHKIY